MNKNKSSEFVCISKALVSGVLVMFLLIAALSLALTKASDANTFILPCALITSFAGGFVISFCAGKCGSGKKTGFLTSCIFAVLLAIISLISKGDGTNILMSLVCPFSMAIGGAAGVSTSVRRKKKRRKQKS